jgi:hypothetical protein
MVPDAELSVVGKRVAEETPIVGGTGEGYRLSLRYGVEYNFYTITEATCLRIEINTTEIIADRIELITALRNGLSRTEVERTSVRGENGKGLIDGVLLEKR